MAYLIGLPLFLFKQATVCRHKYIYKNDSISHYIIDSLPKYMYRQWNTNIYFLNITPYYILDNPNNLKFQ